MGKLHISVKAEELFHFGGVAVTNSLLTSFIVMIVLVVLAWKVRSEKTQSKSGKSSFYVLAEYAVEGFYKFFENIVGGRTRKLFPILFTFFLFIVVGNWMGLLPGVGSIGIYEHTDHGEIFVPLFRGPSADLNTTLALALISVAYTQYLGIRSLGLKNYAGKFINLKNPITMFVGVLELVSEFAKILSFSFRLFGNVFAGEVLLTVMVFLIPIIVPTPFLILEIFVGFIQALVFTMLTTIFVVVATEKAH